jgi:hypothetical protein
MPVPTAIAVSAFSLASSHVGKVSEEETGSPAEYLPDITAGLPAYLRTCISITSSLIVL